MRLSTAQRRMLKVLRESGPFDICAMSVNFQRKWHQAWSNLKRLGLVEFNPNAKDGLHYGAVEEAKGE